MNTEVINPERLNESSENYLNLTRNNLRLSSTFNQSDKRVKERELMKDAIQSSSNLIHQLIAIKVSDTTDVSLIRKCNLNIKKITGYSKTCHDLLMRYVAYDEIDNAHYETLLSKLIKTLLESANNWVLEVELVYSSSEAHALGGFNGDLSGVGIFSNNTEKSIFEFFEDLQFGLTGWGTGEQRATQLFNNHLSENIKSQTQDISYSYSKLKP